MKLLNRPVYISDIEMEEPTAFGGLRLLRAVAVCNLTRLFYEKNAEVTVR